MGLEEFEEMVILPLKKLRRLEYICFADNPISRFPEIKYIVAELLPQVKYFDYIEIPHEVREMAPKVKELGIAALQKERPRMMKEERRLAAELKESYKIPEEVVKNIPKPDFNIAEILNEKILRNIIQFLPMEDLYSCCLVSKQWFSICIQVASLRRSQILQSITFLIGPSCYYSKFSPFYASLSSHTFFSSVRSNIFNIDFVSEVLWVYSLQFSPQIHSLFTGLFEENEHVDYFGG